MTFVLIPFLTIHLFQNIFIPRSIPSSSGFVYFHIILFLTSEFAHDFFSFNVFHSLIFVFSHWRFIFLVSVGIVLKLLGFIFLIKFPVFIFNTSFRSFISHILVSVWFIYFYIINFFPHRLVFISQYLFLDYTIHLFPH